MIEGVRVEADPGSETTAAQPSTYNDRVTEEENRAEFRRRQLLLLVNRVASLEAQIPGLQQERDAASAERDRSIKRSESLGMTLARVFAEHESTKTKLSATVKELALVGNELQRSHEESAEGRQEIMELQKENAGLREENAGLRAEQHRQVSPLPPSPFPLPPAPSPLSSSPLLLSSRPPAS